MKPEQAMWRAIRPLLKGLDPVRVENLVGPGTPDVNCTKGWIELKYIAKWPKDHDVIVKVEHFTPQQKAWLLKRWLVDRRAWLLLKVGENDWLWFTGRNAQIVGTSTRLDLYKYAERIWARTPKQEELVSCLLP